MVHDMEVLRCQLEKQPDSARRQSSARQYAEDLEIQLEHVECLKGDLELELTKAQAEIRQLKACMQVPEPMADPMEVHEVGASLQTSSGTLVLCRMAQTWSLVRKDRG